MGSEPMHEDVLALSEVSFGTFVGLGSIGATEVCALCGFDWLLFDLEHGAGNEKDLISQIAVAKRHGLSTVVRVETPSRIRCGRVLDLGADAVMAPRLDSAREAADFVRHLRYPPEGDRGVATYHSAAGFGLNPNYFEHANANTVAIVQIESLGALEDVGNIARTEGVNVLFVGPRDLAAALGVEPGESLVFSNALAKVVAACRRSKIAAGILAGDAASAARYEKMGFTFIAIGSDSSFLAHSAKDAVASARLTAETRRKDRPA